jgi:maltooligosyltrehalose trehalohydrolase
MVLAIDIHKRKIGVNFDQGIAEILLWAPVADQAKLILADTRASLDLLPQEFGYWYLRTERLQPGQSYLFELRQNGNVIQRADPASLRQVNGVHGASTAFNAQDYQYTDKEWKGLALDEYIIYELHVGTFTSAGDFSGLEQKLDHLVELGVNAVELMPLASFPGNRNWGYDGVFPFAVQESYGGPLGLQMLVNACHLKGLAVILDVVYNHNGPEGNYLADFAPYYTDKYQTPWGLAINFDDAHADGVRNFYIENVLMWFRDFNIDALRLDAVHAIKDLSAKHILAEMREHVDELNKALGKRHHLIIECDLNDPKYINPLQEHGYGMDAQWNDEFHHALRVTAGQERTGYYADFQGITHLAKAYQDAYVYDGIFSEERQKTFGSSASANSGEQFVVFSQNHDQVGNRMLGERSGVLYSLSKQKILAAAVFMSPFIPLLFMGEEWGETNPFLYFVSHSDPDLIDAVRKGRSTEFTAFHQQGEAPDPQDPTTFEQSKLQWDLQKIRSHQQLLAFYKALINLRKSNQVLNKLNRERLKADSLTAQNCLLLHRWNERDKLVCFFNFSNQKQAILFADSTHWQRLLDSEDPLFGGREESYFDSHNSEVLIIQPESFLIYAKYDVQA